jgi:prepilin-type N-terminal cleavage/methylation domain-containing protein
MITLKKSSGAPARLPKSSESGFTLLEVILAITLFGMLVTIGYRAMVNGTQAKMIVRSQVIEQTMMGTAHRTLQQVFSSASRVKGSSNNLEIDLNYADNNWLDGVQFVRLTYNSNRELVAFTDTSAQGSLLMSNLNEAGFRYVAGGQEQSTWNLSKAPDAIIFFWSHQGYSQRWWFSTQ